MDLKINKQLMKVKRQLMMNEPIWWCGTRIRTGAIAAAIIGAICSAIMTVGFLIIGFTIMNIPNSKEVRYITWTASSLNVISLLLYTSVIVMYAAKKDKAWVYLPYLIIQGIILVLHLILTVLANCLYIILCILYAKAVATVDIGHPNDGVDDRAVGIIFIMSALLLFAFVLEAYLYSVIWRAYMFTKDFFGAFPPGETQSTRFRKLILF